MVVVAAVESGINSFLLLKKAIMNLARQATTDLAEGDANERREWDGLGRVTEEEDILKNCLSEAK